MNKINIFPLLLIFSLILSNCGKVEIETPTVMLPATKMSHSPTEITPLDPAIDAYLSEIREGQCKGNLILSAIENFYQDNKHYPDQLEDLVPFYLEEIPITDTGQPFIYRQTPDIYVLLFHLTTKNGVSCAYTKRLSDWECSQGRIP